MGDIMLANTGEIDRTTKASTEQLIDFTEMLRDQMDAGLPIQQAIAHYAETSKKPKLAMAFQDIAAKLYNGMEINQALALYPNIFPREYCALISAAKKSGKWTKKRNNNDISEGILDLLVIYLKRAGNTRRKVLMALMYPSLILIAVMAAVVIFAFFVIPSFKEIFEALDAEKTLMTSLLFSVGDLVQDHYMALPIVALVGIGFLILFWQRAGKTLWQRYQIRIIGFKRLFTSLILAETFWLMSVLYSSGLNIQECLDITAQACRNIEVAKAILAAKRSIIDKGMGFAEALKKSHPLFEGDVFQVMSRAEKTGSMDKAFKSYAERLFEKVDDALDQLVKMIEPAVLVIVGFIVAILLVSFYGSIGQMIGKLANH